MSLTQIYQDYRSGGEQIAELGDAFFAPILIDPPEGWAQAHHRIAIVGQETGEWNFSPENARQWGYEWKSEQSILSLSDFLSNDDSVSLLQQGYSNFGFAKHNAQIRRSPFWRYFRQIKEMFERDDRSTSVLFTNLIRCSADTADGRSLWNISENDRTKILWWQNGLLTRELQSIAPTAVIFLTGPNYDVFLRSEFSDLSFNSFGDFDPRVLCELSCPALACPSFRTCHPGYLNRSHKFAPLEHVGTRLLKGNRRTPEPAFDKDAVWFITGCSTGFGRELAQHILGRGGRAVVSARDAARVQDLVGDAADRALALSLDVTQPAQIAAAVEAAEQKFGAIDVLVNNAGYGYMAAIEEGDDAEIRAQFEANVFGLIAMTQAVLPGMRARKRGHIVNLSSQGGLVGFPGVGFYNATKFAVEGLSEALAGEIRPLGLGVTIVEPGPFRTDWAGRSLRGPKHEIDAYAETAGARRRGIAGYSGKQAGDPVRAAAAIVRAVESEHPPLHLVLGKQALDIVRRKLAALSAEIDDWEDTSRSADFPV